jgi:hypothetical protein
VRHRLEKENAGSKVFMFSIDRFDGVKAPRRAMTGMDGDSSSSLSVSSSHQPLWRDLRPLKLARELEVIAVSGSLSSSSSDQTLIWSVTRISPARLERREEGPELATDGAGEL